MRPFKAEQLGAMDPAAHQSAEILQARLTEAELPVDQLYSNEFIK
jgi:hypothetical protein